MAIDRYILANIGKVLESQSFVTNNIGVVDGVPAIHVAKTGPVGRVYPCITLDLDIGNSHPQFGTTEAIVTVTIWMNGPHDENANALAFLKPFNNRIVKFLNNKPCLLNDIVKEENSGLRVSRFLKTFSKEYDYDEDLKKFFSVIIFDVVMSECEDFTTSYGPE